MPPCCTGPGGAAFPGLRCRPHAPGAPPLRRAPWCRHGAARPLPRDATRRPAPARSTAARHRRCPRSVSRFRDWRRARCPLPTVCRGTPAPVHGRHATPPRRRAAATRRSSGRVQLRRTTRRWTRTRARSESASGFRRPRAVWHGEHRGDLLRQRREWLGGPARTGVAGVGNGDDLQLQRPGQTDAEGGVAVDGGMLAEQKQLAGSAAGQLSYFRTRQRNPSSA